MVLSQRTFAWVGIFKWEVARKVLWNGCKNSIAEWRSRHYYYLHYYKKIGCKMPWWFLATFFIFICICRKKIVTLHCQVKGEIGWRKKLKNIWKCRNNILSLYYERKADTCFKEWWYSCDYHNQWCWCYSLWGFENIPLGEYSWCYCNFRSRYWKIIAEKFAYIKN